MALRGELIPKPTYTAIRTITDEGSTAICHKCYHEVFQAQCVQKTVSMLGATDSFASTEPRLLRSLSHPYLIDVWEAQWDPEWGDQAVTFTMPFYEGGSLHAALMSGHTFSMGEAISLTCNILDALHYLHVERNLVHRDIKPGNIFLANDLKTALLGDFGSAASIQNGSASCAGGTPLYKAPEWRSGSYTTQSDLYSLGLVLREMLGGRFRYEDVDMDDVDRRLLSGNRTLRGRDLAVPSFVPDDLRRVVNKLLQKESSSRPASALEVQRALQNIQHLNWRTVDSEFPMKWAGEVTSGKLRVPRDVEATAVKITRGPNSGMIRLSARWRHRNANRWRNLEQHNLVVTEDNHTEWRAFFKSVSTAMLQSTARR
ncbi:serine/threonine protein kinase [Pseudonocardia oroxyli]|uniref:non-specific serine/threonine protein kinase n=1 Tax=Pseudonocardia oroxyli TaxID=366584 RepID=A0A1G7X0I1_PSEOR|nr:serine/threonine-protein kinase [Pseudonocardia oroxyli]SDG77647.1 Serine/threonine protein kinase [Pseudonocardia oroxyli]